MYFVDDINTVFGGSRGEIRLFPQHTDVIHAVVAGSVNLHDIHHGTIFDSAADFARPTRVAAVQLETVDRLCQNLRAGGLSCSARSCEEVRVRNPASHQLIFERYGDLWLPYYVRKDLRPPLSVQDLIHMRTSL